MGNLTTQILVALALCTYLYLAIWVAMMCVSLQESCVYWESPVLVGL